MFQIGDHILYGLHGVCKIDSVEEKKFDDETHSYYILKPIFDKGSTIFVSTKKEQLVAKMIPLLSKSKIEELLDKLPCSEKLWIENESERKDTYRSIIESSDRSKQLSVLKAILLHKDNLILNKRKMHTGDEISLKNIEKRLYEEFSFVLHKTTDEVKELIRAKIY